MCLPRVYIVVSERALVRGVICKCTQNCRRRGAAVGPRSSAVEVETEKKTEGARAARVWHVELSGGCKALPRPMLTHK